MAQKEKSKISWKNLAFSLGAREKLTEIDFFEEINDFLEQGIDPNLPLSNIDHDTMLVRAALDDNCSDIVKLILSKGAKVNIAVRNGGGWTSPLHIAARNKAFINLELMLPHTNNVNGVDYAGNTPLHILFVEAYWDTVDNHKDPHNYLKIIKGFIQKGGLITIPFAKYQAPATVKNIPQLAALLGCEEIERVCRDSFEKMHCVWSQIDKDGSTFLSVLPAPIFSQAVRYFTADEYNRCKNDLL